MDDNIYSSSPLSQQQLSSSYSSIINPTMPWLDSSTSTTLPIHDQLSQTQNHLSSQSRQSTTWAGVLKKSVADNLQTDSSDVTSNATSIPDRLQDNLLLSTTTDLLPNSQLSNFHDNKLEKTPSTPHHIFRPTEATAFIPLLPAYPISLPTAILHSDNGTIKTSFRRWKWEASTLPRPAVFTTTIHTNDNMTQNTSTSTNLYQQQTRLSKQQQLSAPPEFEAMLLATMSRLSEAEPAALAAAAAFRAISPFLSHEQRVSLHRSFATTSPLECLALVVRYAELVSSRSQSPVSTNIFRQDNSRTHTPAPKPPTPSMFSPEHSSLGLLPNVAGQRGDLWASPSSGKTVSSWENIDHVSRSILQDPIHQGIRTSIGESSPSSFDLSSFSVHLPNAALSSREKEASQFLGFAGQGIQGSDLWWKSSSVISSKESDQSNAGAWDAYYQSEGMDTTNNSRSGLFSSPLPTGLNVNAPPFRVDRPSPSRNDGL